MALTQVQGGMILPSTTLTTPIIATTMGVGGATPASSGSGITFPASQSASTDANTLDDYEEGTWTPTFGGNGVAGTATYSVQAGKYTKFGRLVVAQFDIIATSVVSGATGVGIIRGLPFASAASYSGFLDAGGGSVGYFNGISGANYTYNMYLDTGTTFAIPVYANGGTGINYLAVGNIGNGTRMAGVVTYTVS